MFERIKKLIGEEELEKELAERQKEIDKQYAEEGYGEPSDDVLKKQVELNTIRHKVNISDKEKRIYDRFVQ